MGQHTTWQPVTIPAHQPEPSDGIDFALTPAERSRAALVTAQIETLRIERNKADDDRALASIELA